MEDVRKQIRRGRRPGPLRAHEQAPGHFGQLRRRLEGITQSTLTKQLRELEQDGFLHREIYREIPPRVEYRLTELGESFIPVLYQMLSWSEERLCPPDYVNPYGDQAPEP